MGADGIDLSCPGSSVVAKGHCKKNPSRKCRGLLFLEEQFKPARHGSSLPLSKAKEETQKTKLAVLF